MGIQIRFFPTRPATIHERILDKLKACFETIRFFQGLFFPQDAEVWFTAPSEALGGNLAKKLSARNLYEASNVLYEYLKNLSFEDVTKTIVMFKGKWEFSKTKLWGYFSIQNHEKWREVYGDIEVSAYAKKEFEDLVDALWFTHDMSNLIPKFLRSLKRGIKRSSIGLSQVTFSRGVPTREDPTNLMALYLVGERRRLLGIFYEALKESRDRRIITKAKPLSTPYLLNTLVKEDVVEERFNKRLHKAMVFEIKQKSALYIAKERDSFATLYREISDAILKPALDKLPKENAVKEMIQRGLQEYREQE